ncbi:hypothetical protein KSC_002340 [Ktedonobacter sp. SOSP1-52]|uniref:helix-turn-helix domain-containing protein n=1 Tax=Ktedonobacter sp. SOSP1-52 TaxID=2778366 RepID=UPI00191670FA|nr:helix-turn-helix domain-containing protein [Ktedonobacter sp. SOSP1-52]GHO61342.1 hypothetical protein KSC_002340 [Ktedonobacter sp. SOSP1-52]
MENYLNIPDIPNCVTVSEAAKTLGLAYKTVYEYVTEGRLPAVKAGRNYLILKADVEKFQPNVAGRPRKKVPIWRISSNDNPLFSIFIKVHPKDGMSNLLIQRLEHIRKSKQHLFPGTIGRYIIAANTQPEELHILLIWKESEAPEEEDRERVLEAFRYELRDVLDWGSAQYFTGKVLMHT